MAYQKDVWRYVKDRASNVETLARHLLGEPHRTEGDKLWYCCPFHSEDTPSLAINKRQTLKGIGHCFGCSKHFNSVLDLYAEAKGVTISGALEEVAQFYNIDISSFLESETQQDSMFKQYVTVNDRVAKKFAASLQNPHGAGIALDYWVSRGLSAKTINDMLLGFAPSTTNSGIFLQYLRDTFPGYPIEKFGLVDVHTGGCKFTDRFIIPIRDYANNIVGFGGRTLDPNAKAKYLNTAQNDWFNKGALLYNYNNAKKYPSVLLVEGYLDSLSLTESDVLNSSALMGTSLTSDHITMLEGKDLILCLDNDEAGKKATLKIITEKNYLPFKVIETPDPYKDVNDFLLANGAEATRKYYTRPKHRMDFVFDYYKGKLDLTKLNDRMELARCVMDILEYASLVEQDYYAKRLCRLLGIEGRYKKLREDINDGLLV